MYKYGIAYYQAQGQTRVPVTGLTVRLVRPLASWASGITMQETAPGYYEATVLTEAQCGFYEIWDTASYSGGAPSGKHAIIGKLDLNGIQGGSNFLLQLAQLQNIIANMHQIHGADLYVQDVEPDTNNDYVWIDTTGVDYIS